MKKYCLALDLIDDPGKIRSYERHHQNVWPEIKRSIREAGITSLEIYRWKNRLVMIMEVDDDFNFEKKRKLDEENPKVQEWEQLMWEYQQALPGTGKDEKWMLMDKIYQLEKEE